MFAHCLMLSQLFLVPSTQSSQQLGVPAHPGLNGPAGIAADAIGSPSPTPAADENSTRLGATPWMRAVENEIERGEYFWSTTLDGAYSAPNRAQDLRSRIGPAGIEVFPRETPDSGEAPRWKLALRTRSFGIEGDTHSPGEAWLARFENRVDLHFAAFSEWYVNDERGIEQGWTIGAPPTGPASHALRIEIDTRGLRPVFAADGESALFVDDAGVTRLRYHGLRAFDAAGRDLPARLLSIPAGLALLVEAENALYPITIDPVLDGPNWTVESNQNSAQLGYSVCGAGDVNGDGFDDLIVGAPFYDNGQTDEGRAFLYLGSASGPSLGPDWTSADTDQAFAALGRTVGGGGDVNGDGFDDVVVAAPVFDNGQTNEGRVYLYLGSANGPSLVPDWTEEIDDDQAAFGQGLSVAGDVNGDGFDDVAVGAWGASNHGGTGAAFVYFGSASGPSLLPDWTAASGQFEAFFGTSICTAGDVNGDGFDDVIVGAHQFTNDQSDEGRAFLYFGSASGPSAVANWTSEGNQANAQFGYRVSAADVNGDGFHDVIVGARYWDNGQTDEGRAYVYLGSSSGPSLVPDWTAESDQANAEFGLSVAGAGDVNADGFDEVLVGAFQYSNGQAAEGRAFLYLGSAGGPSLSADWTAESDQVAAHLGWSVAGAGDVNGNGFDDVIVGAPTWAGGTGGEGRASLYMGCHPVLDCNANDVDDYCDISTGASSDCNANEIPDECDIASATSSDCNENGIPDECDIASATSGDCNSNGVPDECETEGVWFCAGDGAGTPCPCGNSGEPCGGCANSAHAGGCRLSASGNPSVSGDTLVLMATNAIPGELGLFFQGDDAVNGGAGEPWGDGLRCAGTNVRKLEVVHLSAFGESRPNVPISVGGNVSAGDNKSYQFWYRDPTGPCGNGFNLSNGVAITWLP